MFRTIIFFVMALSSIYGSAQQNRNVIIPKAVIPGSKIAIVTPASCIKDELLDSVYDLLSDMGFKPQIYPHAYGKEYGSYPATDESRLSDLMAAFTDPEIDAILCARGGYGCVRLLPHIDKEIIRANPKWLIGYSDISDLHAMIYHAGVASIHGPMVKHLVTEPDSLLATQYLFKVMADSFPISYDLPSHPYDKYGSATGRLVGGNLLTINGLSETPNDVLSIGDKEDAMLFIEDIGEKIYAIERVLMRLHQSGNLAKFKGIIIGQFTEYKPSDDFETMEDMIYYWLKQWGYYDPSNLVPIVFNFPTGHVSDNYPMIVSAETVLEVSPQGTKLTFTGN